MTRRIRLWIMAVLSIAATALMVSLTVAAQADVNQTHTHPALAGSTSNMVYSLLPYIEQELLLRV